MEFHAVIKVDAFHDYMEILFVFIIIFTGTYTYTLNNWISPFILFLYGIMIAGYAAFSYFLCQSLAKKEDDFPLYKIVRTIDAAVVWVSWLIYGTIFRNIRPVFSSVPILGHTLSAITFALVLLTYHWNGVGGGESEEEQATKSSLDGNPSTKKSAMIVFIAFLMLIPHSENSYDNSLVLFAKVSVFYFLYLLTEFYQVLQRKYEKLNRYNTTKEDKNWLYKLELKIIQSAWVLLVSEYLIGAFVLQLIPLCNQIWWYVKRVYDTRHFLPTTSPRVKKKDDKNKTKTKIKTNTKSQDNKKKTKPKIQKPKKKKYNSSSSSSGSRNNTINSNAPIVHTLGDTSVQELQSILTSKINIVEFKENPKKKKKKNQNQNQKKGEEGG